MQTRRDAEEEERTNGFSLVCAECGFANVSSCCDSESERTHERCSENACCIQLELHAATVCVHSGGDGKPVGFVVGMQCSDILAGCKNVEPYYLRGHEVL